MKTMKFGDGTAKKASV